MGDARTQSTVRGIDRTQIFTPPDLADFMVGKLDLHAAIEVDLLEPGAGAGALAEAVVAASTRPVRLTLVERDATLGSHLSEFIADQRNHLVPGSEAVVEDFFSVATAWVAARRRFTHIVMNPPFGRVEPMSAISATLRLADVRATNYFSAFLWLACDLLADGGTLVAVVPRSVLSGVRYAATRAHVFNRTELVALHHFTDRRAVFERDSVQQEVVVLKLVRGSAPTHIQFSQSATMADISEAVLVPSNRMKLGAQQDYTVLVPTVVDGQVDQWGSRDPLLPEGVSISVGSIVDFRMEADITARGDGEIPLIGSEEFFVREPELRSLRLSEQTRRFVYPPGRYVVIRRISPSEARPRIQAKMIIAEGDEYAHGVAFENHLLVLHANKAGLDPASCNILLERLSDAKTEAQFRERGGTTQVNVSDVKSLCYEGRIGK